MTRVAPPRARAPRRFGVWPALVHWLSALGIMLLALRPLWTIPLQADDFLQLFIIHYDADLTVMESSVSNMVHWATVSDTHFNPLGNFLEALLKGGMLATTSPVITASVLHYGTIVALTLITLPLATMLLSRLVRLYSGTTVSCTTLAVPVAVGFAAAAQLTALWSMFDPLVAQPVFGALPTVLGIAYLSTAIGALQESAPARRVAVPSLIGVVGFLVYESMIVFVAALLVVAWTGRRRGLTGLRSRLPWLVVPAMTTFLVSRVIVAGHPDTGYGGTKLSLDPAMLPAWSVATATSQPGGSWGIASRYVDVGRVVPFALLSALLVGAALAAWALLRRRRLRAPEERDDGAGAPDGHLPTDGRGMAALRPLLPLAALALLAPLPYLVSEAWRDVLLTYGTTYLHSLTVLWCWAMAFALLAVILVPRLSGRWLGLALVVVTIWVGVQFSINRQLAAELTETPFFGIDVAQALTSSAGLSEPDRCASLAQVRAHPVGSAWIEVLNREFEERHGEPYCRSSGG